jgi:hypothetical protein
MDTPDIEITGSGFFQLRATSRKGTTFMRRVEGFAHGCTYCDDSRLTQDIADGAIAKGLRVRVNGQTYEGDGRP